MLTKTMIIRAWRDKAFRNSLTEEDLGNLPPHPSGLIELSDKDSRIVAGGSLGITADPADASTCFQCGPPSPPPGPDSVYICYQ